MEGVNSTMIYCKNFVNIVLRSLNKHLYNKGVARNKNFCKYKQKTSFKFKLQNFDSKGL
jgi:hypothetical protein